MTRSPLEEIKKLYYGATKSTIVRDFDRAVDLLKAMGSEEDRERATVYMHGLAEMKSQWAGPARSSRPAPPSGARRSAAAPGRSGRSRDGGRRPR